MHTPAQFRRLVDDACSALLASPLAATSPLAEIDRPEHEIYTLRFLAIDDTATALRELLDDTFHQVALTRAGRWPSSPHGGRASPGLAESGGTA